MSEVARLRMEIAGRKYRLNELASGIRAKTDHIRDALANPVAAPDAVKFSVITEISAALEKLQDEYSMIQSEIRDLEKALNG
jgi:predicted RNase H-like nuclease (RuvC/YqgF family)